MTVYIDACLVCKGAMISYSDKEPRCLSYSESRRWHKYILQANINCRGRVLSRGGSMSDLKELERMRVHLANCNYSTQTDRDAYNSTILTAFELETLYRNHLFLVHHFGGWV